MKRSYGSINTKGTIGGVMSWLITLAPAPDAPNQCVISIVVYSQRTLVGDYLNERTFSSLGGVNKIPSGVAVDTTRLTVGLGEIVLKSTSPDDLMSLKSGSYLLLGGFQNKVPASPTDKKVVFSWYRIRNTGELTGTSAPYSRVITVQGRDWNPVSTSGTPLYKLDTTSVTAHYFPEVVAIYEKTLRLETSSLWSQ